MSIRRLHVTLIVLTMLVVPTTATGAPRFEHVHAMAFDASGATLWLGAHTGLYRSGDGGRTWRSAPLIGHAHDIMAIAVDPTDAAVVYVATHEAGVLKTTDDGTTWNVVNAGLGGVDVHGIALATGAPTKLHAIVRDGKSGVYRTTDGGGTWVRVDDGPAGETKVLASVDIPTGMGGFFLYAGTAEGLVRSPDCF